MLGRRLERVFPSRRWPRHALAVAVMSYDGGMDFGLLGDYDALPDLDAVAIGIAGPRRLLGPPAAARRAGRPRRAHPRAAPEKRRAVDRLTARAPR